MPNSGSGAVAIPQINQTVATPNPDLEPNPYRAEPIVNDAGQGVQQAGKALLGVFMAQQDHANAIDVAQRMGQFQQDFGNAKVAALNSGQTGPQMVSMLQGAASKLIDQYTNGTNDPNNPNPPNRAVARQLAMAMNSHVAEQMGSFPVEAAVRVSHDLDYRFQQQTSMAAGQIGQNYTIGGTADAPTFQLNADGLQQMQRQIGTIDQAYPPDARPTENQFYRNMLAQKAALQTGMAVAQDHPTLIGHFIDQHADMLPVAQQIQLRNSATEAINLPMRQIDANNNAVALQLMHKFDAQAVAGNLDTASLETAAQHKLVPESYYQKMTGVPLAIRSDPGAVDAATSAIKNAESPEELDDLNAAIRGNPNIRGKASVMLPAMIENAKRQMNTVAGQARLQGYDQIRRSYQGVGGPLGPTMYNMTASISGAPTIGELQANAKADFEAAIYGETNPGKIRAAMQKAIKDNAPDASLVKPTTGAPSPAPSWMPHRLPGESLSAYGARVKAASPGSPGTTVPAVGPPAITDDEARAITAYARKTGLIR